MNMRNHKNCISCRKVTGTLKIFPKFGLACDLDELRGYKLTADELKLLDLKECNTFVRRCNGVLIEFDDEIQAQQFNQMLCLTCASIRDYESLTLD